MTLEDVKIPIIRISIGQFYGIEINDFAVTVAETALWIAESQMLRETEKIVRHILDFLPLKSYANITEGSALQMDWESVVARNELSYIVGNPPFVGARMMSFGNQPHDGGHFVIDASLADLYDETLMPPELRRTHQKNDRAVMSAYGFSVNHMTENMCAAELMRRYQELTKAE